MRILSLISPPRRALAAVLAALLLAPASAHAADGNGRYVVRGIGGETCDAYLKSLSDPTGSSRAVSWLMGYATARNQNDAQTFDILPTADGLDFARVVGVVCRGTPSATLDRAAAQALVALRPLRQVAETPLVTLASGGRTAQFRKGAVQLLQLGLAAKKFYKGPATGVPDPDLYKAVRDLQAREKLAVTGLPDLDTFVRAIIKR